MSYSHLSIIERGQLETLHLLGWSTRVIAIQLGRHHSTIAREIASGQHHDRYEAMTAQVASQVRRTRSVPTGKFTQELGSELLEKLEKTWSLEQVAEKQRMEGKPFVCFKTIYRWLYDGSLTVSETQVCVTKESDENPWKHEGGSLSVLRSVSAQKKSANVQRLVIGSLIQSCPVEERAEHVQPPSLSVKHASTSL
jgi:IS30 family transposase